jgi:hypothetical protein
MNLEGPVLIVGKNSKIVSEIKEHIHWCDIISHCEIDSLNLTKYRKIFLFSWSHISLESNLQLISKLPLSRVVFISSIAVLACARRPQWAAYPKAKLACENVVLNGGGKVIRIGIWDHKLLNKLPGLVPVTTKSLLFNAMLCSLTDDEKKVYFPITLESGGLDGLKLQINVFLNKISIFTPNIKIIQILLVLASKIIGLKDYGYTHDSLYFFCHRVLVGYGAVGSAVSRQLTSRGWKHSIVVSTDANQFLVTEGFNGTRIGRFKEGLSMLWHGVWISSQGTEKFQKNVPFFVARPRLPKGVILGSVVAVDIESPVNSIAINNPLIADVRIFAKVFHLAAGVVNNIKIFQRTHAIEARLSDQEICVIGEVATNELVSKKIIGRKCGLVFGRTILKSEHFDIDYMLDFRPTAHTSINLDAENIYNNRTEQVLLKLFKNLSPALINQAVFNKFGISIDVGRFSVVAQIEAHNCISLKSDGSLSRARLSNTIIDSIAKKISIDFKSFMPSANVYSADAIHLHGGFQLNKYPDLSQLVLDNRLFFHGNVFDGKKLGPFHNTVLMINRESEIIKNV